MFPLKTTVADAFILQRRFFILREQQVQGLCAFECVCLLVRACVRAFACVCVYWGGMFSHHAWNAYCILIMYIWCLSAIIILPFATTYSVEAAYVSTLMYSPLYFPNVLKNPQYYKSHCPEVLAFMTLRSLHSLKKQWVTSANALRRM